MPEFFVPIETVKKRPVNDYFLILKNWKDFIENKL